MKAAFTTRAMILAQGRRVRVATKTEFDAFLKQRAIHAHIVRDEKLYLN
jgi:hypothetical protein